VNKSQLKSCLLALLDREIDVALAAARTAQESASHEGNKPENQYDTLSLEAAYLAHGQSERILALQQERIHVARWAVPVFDEDAVLALGALVGLEPVVATGASIRRWFWLTPVGGRTLLQSDQSVQLVSISAPLAKRLLKLGLDDELQLGEDVWRIVAVS
tara:strand:+ start:4111 stop:4590 length:480 start_codon:yes stop_codon:yes gene_type:complete